MIEPILFTTDPREAETAMAAGIGTFIVDWELRGKERRQRGFDTEINRDTPEDLHRMAAVENARVICRINPWGGHAPAEVEAAVEAGATDILLPMVTRPEEVERFLASVAGRCGAGILVETVEACACSPELSRFPLDLVYVGLNDLAISTGAPTIFHALVDGTVERLREVFSETSFGFGGLTCIDRGEPIPCRLLLAEMVRVRADFSFLRRSFKRDIAGRDWAAEMQRLRREEERLARRPAGEIADDRAALAEAVEGWAGHPW
ncbi:MAG: aldolase [Acidobacteria bacterium]|nr:aldolase [Acidobacteriota bacterium]